MEVRQVLTFSIPKTLVLLHILWMSSFHVEVLSGVFVGDFNAVAFTFDF